MARKCTPHYWARFLSLARSNRRLWSDSHRAGYFSNLTCDWLSIVCANSEQETENGPCLFVNGIHWSLVNSSYKVSVTWSYDVPLFVTRNRKQVVELSVSYQWLGTRCTFLHFNKSKAKTKIHITTTSSRTPAFHFLDCDNILLISSLSISDSWPWDVKNQLAV